jgi:hypothetical protein
LSEVAGKFGGIDQLSELASSLPAESMLIYTGLHHYRRVKG